MDGLLVVDKPVGPTSHDVVAKLRRVVGEQRIGHTGTLDPMASGVLPLVIGRATRLARFLSAGNKSYLATISLGTSTDTGDAEGRPLGREHLRPLPTEEIIDRVLDGFRGTYLQRPPAFSAKKIEGRRSHRLARARRTAAAEITSVSPELPVPVGVTAHAIGILSVDGASITLHVECSAGFYVRALAHDLGERLGTGAHLTGLRRTMSGGLTLADAVPFSELDDRDRGRVRASESLISLSQMLPHLPRVELTAEGARRTAHGRPLNTADVAGTFPVSGSRDEPVYYRLFNPAGHLVAIARASRESLALHPAVVLV